MPTSPELDKPSPNAYPEWLRRNYDIDLLGGNQELWHETITPGLRDQFMQSPFWRALVDQLSDWNDEYRAENSDYDLVHGTALPELVIEPYISAVEKSFRWNVVQNERWPSPPIAPTVEELARATRPEEAGNWNHPGNWLHHFTDIIRTRLTVVYLDGVTVLANKLTRSAEELGNVSETRFQAQPDGYHAVHVLIGHTFNTFDLDSQVAVTVPAKVIRKFKSGLRFRKRLAPFFMAYTSSGALRNRHLQVGNGTMIARLSQSTT